MTCPTTQRTLAKDVQQLYRTIDASTDGQAAIIGVDDKMVMVSLRPKAGYNAHAEFQLTVIFLYSLLLRAFTLDFIRTL
ncbi:hypothetical protein TSMEX_010879 [Taenia solium]